MIIYGRIFGVGMQMDAWVLAAGTVAAAGSLAWGPVNEIVRSRFLQQAEHHGFELAARNASQLIKVSAMASAALAVLLLVLGPQLLALLYEGTYKETANLIFQVFSLLLPSLAIVQMLALTSAYLNCCKVIYAPEWIGIGAGILSLVCVVLLAESWGIYSLVVAHYVAITISLAGSWWILYRRKFIGSTSWLVIDSSVLDYIRFAKPLYISYASGQANAILERSMASSLAAGSVSSLYYAGQIKSTLQAVITSVLFSLAVPQLTRAVFKQDGLGFEGAWREVQGVISLFLVATVPPIFAGSSLIVAVLFGANHLETLNSNVISDLIKFYVLALIPVSLYLVHGAALLAKQRSKTYAVWGVLSQGISIGLMLALFPHIGLQAFPAALFVSHFVAAAMMAREVGPSAGLWKDLTLSLLLLFVVILLEQILFEWLFLRFHEPIISLALGLLIHGMFVAALLVLKLSKRVS